MRYGMYESNTNETTIYSIAEDNCRFIGTMASQFNDPGMNSLSLIDARSLMKKQGSIFMSRMEFINETVRKNIYYSS